jgi:hypothetical protein
MSNGRDDDVIKLFPLTMPAQLADRIGRDLVAVMLGQFELPALEAHATERKRNRVLEQIALRVPVHRDMVNKTGTQSRADCWVLS